MQLKIIPGTTQRRLQPKVAHVRMNLSGYVGHVTIYS